MRTYGHTGATPYGQADMEFDLDSKLGVVIMQNEGLSSNWLLYNAPIYIFGEAQPDVYGTPASVTDLTKQYYLMSRSQYRGMLSFIPVLTAVQLAYPFEDIGNGVYQMRTDHSELNEGGETAAILGTKTLSDGTQLLETTSVDLIPDRNYIPKLLLFTAYFLAALMGFYMLRVRAKLFKTHRDTNLAGSALIGIGHGARLISVIAVLASFVIYYKYTGGMPISAMTVIGVIQMISVGLFCISALSSVVSLVVKKDKTALYILLNSFNIAANALCIGAILFYELYRFWGC